MSSLLSSISRALGVAIAIYIFYDAPKKRRNRWVWAILALLFGLVVLGIYLILTGRKVWGIIWTVVGALELLIVALGTVAAIIGSQS